MVVIYWRDIPAQVTAQAGRSREKVLLPGKFQRAIARAKRKANIYTAHEDIAQWRRVSRPCSNDLTVEASAEAARIDASWTEAALGKLAYVGGFLAAVEQESLSPEI